MHAGWAKKWGHRLMTMLLSNLNLANVATPPCETLMSAKQAINDKLQGSVGTYLR